MATVIVFLSALAALASGLPSFTSPSHPDWLAFKSNHGKTYGSLAEEHYRFELFLKNKDMIEKHNEEFAQGVHTYSLGLNHLADLTPLERKQMKGFLPPPPDVAAQLRAEGSPHSSLGTPASKDWRQEGAVAEVQNQGNCGSCYTFAAAAALEGHEKVKTGKLVKLSEQNLVDCSGQYGTFGCSGGWPSACYTYVQKNHGIDTETAYPYEARQGYCHYTESGKGGEDLGFNSIPQGDERALQDVVGNHGPAAVAINTNVGNFGFYKTGVFKVSGCAGASDWDLDHAVTVVGYGSENGEDYWLVKNSWGATWRDNGYIKMARNYGNMCGIATHAVWPKV